ncbi:hypothetical protein NIES4103_19410 [Nostoc sp. NIES-4103]|nr:hypothetical protein NIES4103_19410 [Nostoc sp. NIES-4103]
MSRKSQKALIGITTYGRQAVLPYLKPLFLNTGFPSPFPFPFFIHKLINIPILNHSQVIDQARNGGRE